MTDESTGFDPYETVLADLKAKRDQLDQAIAAIEAVRSGRPLAGADAGAAPGSMAPMTGPGAFLGMTIPTAAKKPLPRGRHPPQPPKIATPFRDSRKTISMERGGAVL